MCFVVVFFFIYNVFIVADILLLFGYDQLKRFNITVHSQFLAILRTTVVVVVVIVVVLANNCKDKSFP